MNPTALDAFCMTLILIIACLAAYYAGEVILAVSKTCCASLSAQVKARRPRRAIRSRR